MTRMIVNSSEHDTLRESLDKTYLASHLERETMARGFIAKGEKKQPISARHKNEGCYQLSNVTF